MLALWITFGPKGNISPHSEKACLTFRQQGRKYKHHIAKANRTMCGKGSGTMRHFGEHYTGETNS